MPFSFLAGVGVFTVLLKMMVDSEDFAAGFLTAAFFVCRVDFILDVCSATQLASAHAKGKTCS
jgi:hypothetical protein